MRKTLNNQGGRTNEGMLVIVLLGVTMAIVVPNFIKGRYLIASLCLGLGLAPFIYGAWTNWREDRRTARKPEDPR